MIIERFFKEDISCYVYRATISAQIAIDSEMAVMMHDFNEHDFVFREIKSRMMREVEDADADAADIVDGSVRPKDICRNCGGNIYRGFNYCPFCGEKVVSE